MLDVASLSAEQAMLARAVLKKLSAQEKAERKLLTYFPDTGSLRRELYTKHLEFFAAGAKHRERLMLAANRVGKTESVGGYETALHLTGWYPDWWVGKRFDKPVSWWMAGKTNETTRDILQRKMFGKVCWKNGRKTVSGTGLVPAECIGAVTWKQGVQDLIDTIEIKHKSGGLSVLGVKSYQQGRGSFEGTEQDGAWLDEEPPLDIYTEILIRTMTTRGLVLCTFTPLEGLSETVMHFLPGGELKEQSDSGKFIVMATWDDAPHLSEEDKKELWESIPPYQRDARSKGVPQLGSGAIYPVPESDIIVQDFTIPDHWPRGFALDVGWNRTAALWGAYDQDNETLYLIAEHYRGHAEPVVHAEAIKGRGDWVPGCIDPAARGRGQKDGSQLMQDYIDLGLHLEKANNAVEAGIYRCWQRLSGGKLKVFASLSNWRMEYRLYRRDEKGRVVKDNDHLMDATRYLEWFIDQFQTQPKPQENLDRHYGGNDAWMGM